MAQDKKQDEAEAEAPAGGGKKKLIFMVLGALLLVGGSVAGTLMIVGGSGDSSDAQVEAPAEPDRGNATYVDMKPAFTVNLAPEDPVGFMQISMQVLTFDEDVAEELEKHKPLIRNNLVVLFGQQNSTDLRAANGKEKLQVAALETVQSIINEHGSGGEVDNVFFTSFVMQ